MTDQERDEEDRARLRAIETKKTAEEKAARDHAAHVCGTYRNLPFEVEPQGLWLRIGPIDQHGLGFIVQEGLIKMPEQGQRSLDLFEVLAAGPGFDSPYSDKFIENPYAVGDIIVVDPTHASHAMIGQKRLMLVGADKVAGKATLLNKGEK